MVKEKTVKGSIIYFLTKKKELWQVRYCDELNISTKDNSIPAHATTAWLYDLK